MGAGRKGRVEGGRNRVGRLEIVTVKKLLRFCWMLAFSIYSRSHPHPHPFTTAPLLTAEVYTGGTNTGHGQ